MNHRIIVALTPREKRLFETLEEAGGWLSRNQIAALQNRHSLSPHDFQLLERLAEKGLIEKDIYREEEKSLRGTYLYRAIPPIEGHNS